MGDCFKFCGLLRKPERRGNEDLLTIVYISTTRKVYADVWTFFNLHLHWSAGDFRGLDIRVVFWNAFKKISKRIMELFNIRVFWTFYLWKMKIPSLFFRINLDTSNLNGINSKLMRVKFTNRNTCFSEWHFALIAR